MQNNRELARDGDCGLSEAISLGEPHPQTFNADRFGTIGVATVYRINDSKAVPKPPSGASGVYVNTSLKDSGLLRDRASSLETSRVAGVVGSRAGGLAIVIRGSLQFVVGVLRGAAIARSPVGS